MQPREAVAEAPRSAGGPPIDYAMSPQVIFWEVTWACALRCLHCRAEAQPKRHPDELTTEEGYRLLDEMRRFGQPIVVISGGDALMRRDLFDLLQYGTDLGLRMSLAPSATALATPVNLRRVYYAGVRRLSFSLDGATPETHDGFRGVPGSFERTLRAVRTAQDAGIAVQLNTVVSRRTFGDLSLMPSLLEGLGVVLWDVFFLVPTGRAQTDDLVSPEEHEATFNWLYDLSLKATYQVKTTLGQPYRRVMIQRSEGERAAGIGTTNDGKGICFVSHRGDILPSGFLPIAAGNVRRDSLVETYRNSPLFRALRDPAQLKGKCGVCPYNTVCGGCRARAYGVTGDYLAAEPSCVLQPPGWVEGLGATPTTGSNFADTARDAGAARSDA